MERVRAGNLIFDILLFVGIIAIVIGGLILFGEEYHTHQEGGDHVPHYHHD